MSIQPYWKSDCGTVTLYCGTNEEIAPLITKESVDAMVTDPPAGISFMGKHWDTDHGGRDQWIKWMADAMRLYSECLKPGAHSLVWSLPRTSHWTTMAVEDAGFEIRDKISYLLSSQSVAENFFKSLSPEQFKALECLQEAIHPSVFLHIFGSGFPKSHDISAGMDKLAGVEREVGTIDPPATAAAKQWDGWGTALKPAAEFWILARKPCSESTVAKNVLKWGVGGINVDACQVEYTPNNPPIPQLAQGKTELKPTMECMVAIHILRAKQNQPLVEAYKGRWPANVVHSGEQEVLALFPNAPGQCGLSIEDGEPQGNQVYGKMKRGGPQHVPRQETDKSSARFFYCAKASRKERDEGLDDLLDCYILNEQCPDAVKLEIKTLLTRPL